jgi:hypothetical protein
MVRPNFFIVGAPKCGTTALYEYLKAHPDIYMPYQKEPHFFATDIHAERYQRYRSMEAYLALFDQAKREKRVGEASVLYLYSADAARRIHDFDSSARIIVMLRNPVDMIYSMYSQQVYSGEEDLPSLEEALAAEPVRKQGKLIPPGLSGAVDALYYRDLARYAVQVERYFDVFGRDAVHVIIFDDFSADTATVYWETLDFLEVDPGLKLDLKAINQNKRIRSALVHNFFKRPPAWYTRLLVTGRSVVPAGLRHSVTRLIRDMNSQPVRRPPMDPTLRRLLQDEFAPEVTRLSELLDRDLSHWCQDD